MKIRFFSLVTVLILVITGFCAYLSYNKPNTVTGSEVLSDRVTIQPSPTMIPTVTPVPVEYENAPGVYPAIQVKDNKNVYGYINTQGQFVIPPNFDSASDFHDGIAIVTMDGKYLAIDKNGSILYYSDNPIRDFHHGAAVISRYSGEETLYGYIDTKGKEMIKPMFQYASDFNKDNTAYVYSGQGKYDQIDLTGKTLKTFELDSKYTPESIEDGYLIYYDSSDCGVINLQGDEIFPASFREINYLGNQIFALKKNVVDYYGTLSEMPSALFNSKGEQLTDFNLYDITDFYNGYASVTDDTSTYFIDMNGNEVTDLPKFEGRGSVKLFKDVIKATIDHDLIYSKRDQTVIWQNDNSQKLSNHIIVKANKFKANRNILIYYPQVDGLNSPTVQDQINSKLKDLFTSNDWSSAKDEKLSVDDSFQASLIRNLLIIKRDGYDYNFGAAHGNPKMDYYYIDVTTGTFYELKDLFLDGSEYVSVLNNYILADISSSNQDDTLYFENSFTTIAENQPFILSRDTLTIYFYPYEIAAYAAGFPKFEIPIENLYDYINFNGDFWGAFN